MNYYLFLLLITFLGLASLWIGKQSSKNTKNNEDYYLMGRKIGFFPLFMTLLATQVGGGALLGSAEEAYTRGWNVFFYPLGMVVGLLILGLGFGAKIRTFLLTTVAEIFEKKYHSSKLRQIASLLSIASLFFILAAQSIAARKFFLSLGIGGDFVFILFWMILVVYTAFGGLKAVVNTDILQALFILFAFLLAIICALFFQPNIELVPKALSTVERAPWMTWFLMPLLFMLIEQDMGQRCFAAKSPKVVSWASCSAAIVLMVVSIAPIYFGRLAGNYSIEIPDGSSVLVTSVKLFTNPTVATFLITAILMAIVSTADSLICSIGSNLAYDFPLLKNSSIGFSRMITFIIGAIPLILSFIFNNVITMLMFSYELSVSVLFVPVVLAVILPNPKKSSAIISMALGLAGFIFLRDFFLPKEVLTLLFALTGFGINEFLLRKKTLTHSQ